jgi:Fe-S cluster assembly scaffold protein SufB
VAARVAPERVSRLAEDERAVLGQRPLPHHRLPEHLLLRGAQVPRRAASLDEVDPKLLATYEKLGIPLHERAILAGVAVDAVFDSVSVHTSFRGKLAEEGIIFMSFSEAVREHPELVRKYLGTVVPVRDNYFATLNSRGLQRRLVRVHPEGRALPDGAEPPTSASTRPTPGSSSAR